MSLNFHIVFKSEKNGIARATMVMSQKSYISIVFFFLLSLLAPENNAIPQGISSLQATGRAELLLPGSRKTCVAWSLPHKFSAAICSCTCLHLYHSTIAE